MKDFNQKPTMKRLIPLCLTVLLSFCLSSSSEGQARNKLNDIRGNLRLEVITVPEKIAGAFERLNPRALLYLPVKTVNEKKPLVIFLHGSGGSKRTLERARWTGDVKRFAKPGQSITSILVPQSEGHWDPASLNKMLDHVLKTNPSIDTTRIYCVGYSMGGKGTWEWAMHSPERFAAIIPKGFIPDLSRIQGMTQLPIWAMVGTNDSKPRVEGIRAMHQALKDLGSTDIKTTFFEGANHGSAPGEVKKLDGVYDWLFSHTLNRQE